MSWDDFQQLFRFSVEPLELVARGTLVYWGLFLLFRFVLQRDASSLGIADILLLVVIADASQNAMSGGYETVADGAVLVGTIAAWNWLLDWADYRFPRLRRFLDTPPVVLVRRGRLQPQNLRRQMITTAELMGELHKQGVAKLADVKMARMESSGEISVIRNDGAGRVAQRS